MKYRLTRRAAALLPLPSGKQETVAVQLGNINSTLRIDNQNI